MAFQSTVNRNYTQGFVGEIANDGPTRSFTARISSAGTDGFNTNRVGRAFGYSGDVNPGTGSSTQGFIEGTVAVGAGPFAGILINPKHYALYGTTSGGPLAASYDLPQYAEGEFAIMAMPFVELFNETTSTKAVSYGDVVGFVTSSYVPGGGATLPLGALVSAANAGALPTGVTLIPGSKVLNPISISASATGQGNAVSGVTKIAIGGQ